MAEGTRQPSPGASFLTTAPRKVERALSAWPLWVIDFLCLHSIQVEKPLPSSTSTVVMSGTVWIIISSAPVHTIHHPCHFTFKVSDAHKKPWRFLLTTISPLRTQGSESSSNLNRVTEHMIRELGFCLHGVLRHTASPQNSLLRST